VDTSIAEIREKVIALVKNLTQWKIEKVIIFGSRVRGDYLMDSDLDLIVVSKDFEGIKFTDRITEVSQCLDLWQGEYPIEILCYTPSEFERKKNQIGMVRDAVEYGILIDF
jgi:predicted nucleotidyltransferase